MLSAVALWLTVIVEVAVPEFTSELTGVMTPEFVSVVEVGEVLQFNATGMLGPYVTFPVPPGMLV